MSELKKIVLAEDDPHDAELTLVALARNNLANEVVVVRDGEEALDYLFCRGPYAGRSGGLPNVLVLDLKMPKVDGLEVLRQVRSSELLRRLPVIMLTSSREERDVVASYDLGVNAFVVKPVDFQQFVDAVSTIGLFWAILNQPPPAGGTSSRGGEGGVE